MPSIYYRDDDDDFLYGESSQVKPQSSNGVVAHHIENEVQSAISTGSTEQNNDDEQEVDLEEETEEGDADEDDVSFIKRQRL
jgi:hypothetical protein